MDQQQPGQKKTPSVQPSRSSGDERDDSEPLRSGVTQTSRPTESSSDSSSEVAQTSSTGGLASVVSESRPISEESGSLFGPRDSVLSNIYSATMSALNHPPFGVDVDSCGILSPLPKKHTQLSEISEFCSPTISDKSHPQPRILSKDVEDTGARQTEKPSPPARPVQRTIPFRLSHNAPPRSVQKSIQRKTNVCTETISLHTIMVRLYAAVFNIETEYIDMKTNFKTALRSREEENRIHEDPEPDVNRNGEAANTRYAVSTAPEPETSAPPLREVQEMQQTVQATRSLASHRQDQLVSHEESTPTSEQTSPSDSSLQLGMKCFAGSYDEATEMDGFTSTEESSGQSFTGTADFSALYPKGSMILTADVSTQTDSVVEAQPRLSTLQETCREGVFNIAKLEILMEEFLRGSDMTLRTPLLESSSDQVDNSLTESKGVILSLGLHLEKGHHYSSKALHGPGDHHGPHSSAADVSDQEDNSLTAVKTVICPRGLHLEKGHHYSSKALHGPGDHHGPQSSAADVSDVRATFTLPEEQAISAVSASPSIANSTVQDDEVPLQPEEDERATPPEVRDPVPSAPPYHPNNSVHRQYADVDTREHSFIGQWPDTHAQRPEELAVAGFFYAGPGDYVCCHYCGLGLRNWSPDDKPLTVHMQHRPSCGFMRTILSHDAITRTLGSILRSQHGSRLENSQATCRGDTVTQIIRRPEQENQKVMDRRRCKICLDNIANIVFRPCGHLMCCAACAPELRRCPICKTPISDAISVKFAELPNGQPP